jgi:streptomycin 6-kinase
MINWGEAGRAWLEQLPAALAACARQWSLTLQPPFPQLSYNYVAPAVRADGARVVIKAGCPQDQEFLSETEALRLFNGRGMVQLLQFDRERRVMLLERVEPGVSLRHEADPERVVSVAAEVMQRLWQPVEAGHPFLTVEGWGKGFERTRRRYGGTSGTLPAALFDRAEAIYADLVQSMVDRVLLHGDLHHDNILTATRQAWLAIDPKGVVGEPAYETAPLLLNMFSGETPQMDKILAKAIVQLAEEIGLDKERVHGWSLARSVLSALWSLEDTGQGWEEAIACAETLAEIRV